MLIRRSPLLLLAPLALLALLACRSRPDSPPSPSASASVSVSESPAPLPSASAAKAGPDGGAKALSDADRVAYRRYVDALTRGRSATVAKRYPEAVAAFDEAIAARPGDARALAEKGYAAFLAGDLVHAERAFDQVPRGSDRAFQAQVEFNRGLVLEAKKDPAAALVHFWFANQLHPSSAAQAKIGSRAVCPVEVDAKPVAATHVTSFVAVARTLHEHDCATTPANEAAAKAALVVGSPLSVAGKGDFYVVRTATDADCPGVFSLAVLQVNGADFWVYATVGMANTTYGVTSVDDVHLERFGKYVRAVLISAPAYEHFVCTEPHDDDRAETLFDCTGAPDEVPAGRAFPTSSPEYGDHVIDPDAHVRVARYLDRTSGQLGGSADGGRLSSLRLDGDAIKLEGYGCGATADGGR